MAFRCFLLQGIGFALVGLAPLAAWAAPPENAALVYWQAFALMPNETDDDKELLKTEPPAELTEEHRRLVEKYEQALKYLHRAVAIKHVDWGLDLDDGLDTLLPHAQAARRLALAAFLRAHVRLDDGDHDGAIDDVVAALHLGRAVSSSPLVVCLLVDISLQDRAATLLESERIRRLTADEKRTLKRRISALPARLEIFEYLAHEAELYAGDIEKSVVEGLIDEVRELAALPPELFPKEDSVLDVARKLAKRLRERAAIWRDGALDDEEKVKKAERHAANSDYPWFEPLLNIDAPSLRVFRESEERLQRAMAAD